MSAARIILDVGLPSGQRAHAYVSRDVIAVRIDGRTAIAHPRWMDDEQLATVEQATAALAGRGAVS